MKKSWLSIIIALSLCAVAEAGFVVPRDRDGLPAGSVYDTGVEVVTLRQTLNASVITGSSVAIYGVMTSTPRVVDGREFVEIRSTNMAGIGSELLLPPIAFTSTTRNTLIVFNPPVLAPAGFSVNLTSAQGWASVFYRHIATATSPNFFIPYDNTGMKAYDGAQWYGVQAASEVVPGAAAQYSASAVGTESLDFDSTEKCVATTRGLFYGVMASTGDASNYAIFRDTNGATGNYFLPPLFYNSMDRDNEGITAVTRVFYFPWPVIYTIGLSVERNVGTDRFRVFTRPLSSLR